MDIIVHTPVGSYWSKDEWTEEEREIMKEAVKTAVKGEAAFFVLKRTDEKGTREMIFGRETLLNSVIEFVDPQ